MRTIRLLDFLVAAVVSVLLSPAAFAVNEHHAESEAADRAAIVKSEKTGQSPDHPLNIPNPDHDAVNSAGAHTPSPDVREADKDSALANHQK